MQISVHDVLCPLCKPIQANDCVELLLKNGERRQGYSSVVGLDALAALSGASILSVVTRTASTCRPLFASNRCLRSRPLTNSLAAFAIAPAIVVASTLTVVPSVPLLRSS